MELTNIAQEAILKFAKTNKVSREKTEQLIRTLIQNPLFKVEPVTPRKVSEKTTNIQNGISQYSKTNRCFTIGDIVSNLDIKQSDAYRVLCQMENNKKAVPVGKEYNRKKPGARQTLWMMSK